MGICQKCFKHLKEANKLDDIDKEIRYTKRCEKCDRRMRNYLPNVQFMLSHNPEMRIIKARWWD
jgi:hypothetical protein